MQCSPMLLLRLHVGHAKFVMMSLLLVQQDRAPSVYVMTVVIYVPGLGLARVGLQ